MKKVLFLAVSLFMMMGISANGQRFRLPSPIETFDFKNAIALFEGDQAANAEAINALLSKTYVLGGTFDAKYNSTTGTFSQTLPLRTGAMFLVETTDPQFDMSTQRGVFTSTKVSPDKAKVISDTPCTMILEMRPTGKVKEGKVVFAPVKVSFRGMRTGEDVYVYEVPVNDTAE